jgi:hypothetical protein
VPIIPLFLIYNYQSVENGYYWGNQIHQTGIFDRQALMQPQLWYDTLWALKPVADVATTISTLPSVGTVGTGAFVYFGTLLAIIALGLAIAGFALHRRRMGRPSDAGSTASGAGTRARAASDDNLKALPLGTMKSVSSQEEDPDRHAASQFDWPHASGSGSATEEAEVR